MKCNNKKIVTGFIALSTLIVLDAVKADTIQLDKTQFHESFTRNVNISGSVRAGVMYGSSLSKVQPDSLYIDIGSKVISDKLLCVKLLSVDGQYGADFTYKLAGKLKGLNNFKFPTTYIDEVSQYAPDHLAVLAEIKPACKGRSGNIVPALWSDKKDDVIKVYLNSGVSNTFLKLYKNDGGSKKVSCQAVKAEKNTAFDTQCDIRDSSSFKLEKTKILRSHFGSHSRPIKLPIFISKNHM